MNPIVGEGIVNAPLVFDVAVHLYFTTMAETLTRSLQLHLERRKLCSCSPVSESDFDFYCDWGWHTGQGSSHDCDIERKATISEHFLDGWAALVRMFICTRATARRLSIPTLVDLIRADSLLRGRAFVSLVLMGFRWTWPESCFSSRA